MNRSRGTCFALVHWLMAHRLPNESKLEVLLSTQIVQLLIVISIFVATGLLFASENEGGAKGSRAFVWESRPDRIEDIKTCVQTLQSQLADKAGRSRLVNQDAFRYFHPGVEHFFPNAGLDMQHILENPDLFHVPIPLDFRNTQLGGAENYTGRARLPLADLYDDFRAEIFADQVDFNNSLVITHEIKSWLSKLVREQNKARALEDRWRVLAAGSRITTSTVGEIFKAEKEKFTKAIERFQWIHEYATKNPLLTLNDKRKLLALAENGKAIFNAHIGYLNDFDFLPLKADLVPKMDLPSLYIHLCFLYGNEQGGFNQALRVYREIKRRQFIYHSVAWEAIALLSQADVVAAGISVRDFLSALRSSKPDQNWEQNLRAIRPVFAPDDGRQMPPVLSGVHGELLAKGRARFISNSEIDQIQISNREIVLVEVKGAPIIRENQFWRGTPNERNDDAPPLLASRSAVTRGYELQQLAQAVTRTYGIPTRVKFIFFSPGADLWTINELLRIGVEIEGPVPNLERYEGGMLPSRARGNFNKDFQSRL